MIANAVSVNRRQSPNGAARGQPRVERRSRETLGPGLASLLGLIWSWEETKYVTDAFAQTTETISDLKIRQAAKSYTSMVDALVRYGGMLSESLRQRHQELAEEIAGPLWRDRDWVLMAFDGSRDTTPRSVSNEREFFAANYGHGKTAKYRKKKTKGMRRRKNEKNKPQPQAPQAWITMMWHMGLRLPWTWRLGPSNSSERGHVMEILRQEEFPENTLRRCGLRRLRFLEVDHQREKRLSGACGR